MFVILLFFLNAVFCNAFVSFGSSTSLDRSFWTFFG